MSKMSVPPTYKLSGEGVKRSDGLHIPNEPLNRHWQRYLRWVEDGNIPEPEFTEQEIIDREQDKEISDLKDNLRSQNVWLFRMLLEMWKAAKAAGAVSNADIDPEVLAKAGQWITKLDRLKEIDE